MFIQTEPTEGLPATERTEVRILYDDRAIYIGVICFDSEPSRIITTDSRRDSGLGDMDSFQLILDTYHDQQNGFVFGTNAVGTQYDAQIRNEGQSSGGGGAPHRRAHIHPDLVEARVLDWPVQDHRGHRGARKPIERGTRLPARQQQQSADIEAQQRLDAVELGLALLPAEHVQDVVALLGRQRLERLGQRHEIAERRVRHAEADQRRAVAPKALR